MQSRKHPYQFQYSINNFQAKDQGSGLGLAAFFPCGRHKGFSPSAGLRPELWSFFYRRTLWSEIAKKKLGGVGVVSPVGLRVKSLFSSILVPSEGGKGVWWR